MIGADLPVVGSMFAHQGGWDEALLVAIPMAVVAWLLSLAKRRVRRAERAVGAAPPSPAEDSQPLP